MCASVSGKSTIVQVYLSTHQRYLDLNGIFPFCTKSHLSLEKSAVLLHCKCLAASLMVTFQVRIMDVIVLYKQILLVNI